MQKKSEPWNRKCPDCSTIFASVQLTGVCPTCQLVFDADFEGHFLNRRYRIGDSTTQISAEEQVVKQVQKYVRFLNDSKITYEEFNFNLLLYWVSLKEEYWLLCASEMPDNVAQQFANYLDEYLLPLNFRPSPICFMVGTLDSHRVEQKTLELESVYRKIHTFWIGHVETRGKT